jgi:predicted PurR-regulated permease PerM
MTDPKIHNNSLQLRTAVYSILLIAFIAALYVIRYVVLTALIGVGLGVLYIPFIEMMKRKFHIPRALSGLMVVLVIAILSAGIILGLGWLVSDEFSRFHANLPHIHRSLESRLNIWTKELPWLKKQLSNTTPDQIFERLGREALGGIQTGMSVIAGFMIAIVLSIFTAVNSRRYFTGLLSALPARLRPRGAEILQAAGTALRSWAKGQLLDMSVVAMATTLGLWIIGIDYWVVLGILAGLLDVIPYVGPVCSAFVTLIVTLGAEPEKAPWVLGMFFLIQQLEGNLLIPLIMREEADLPEVPLLILILLMSAWFGLLGALLAAPLLATSRTIYLMTHKLKMDQHSVEDNPPNPVV